METTQSLQNGTIGKSAKIPSYAKKRSFYLVASFLALVFVLGGFTTTYITQMANGTFSGSPLVHLHGLFFFSWILLFIAQPFLIRSGRTSLHRKIGVGGFILAACMLVAGVSVAIMSAKMGRAGGTALPPNAFLLVPLTDMVLFCAFIVCSLINLKNPETHKRLMVLATVALLPAAFGRIFQHIDVSNPIIALLALESITLLGIAYDLKTRKSVHKVYLIGGGLMFLVHLVRFPLSTTPFWLSIAEWITK